MLDAKAEQPKKSGQIKKIAINITQM